MSNILINASNLKAGGGLQVADSICRQLYKFKNHRFIVVISNYLELTGESVRKYDNVEVLLYNISNSFLSIVLGIDRYLDRLVDDYKVDAVLTIFGPSRWQPRVPHLCGFARAQLLLTDSPYYNSLSIRDHIKYRIWTWGFLRSSKIFYTENPYISKLLPRLIKDAKVYTVSNYYNQIFDHPDKWRRNVKLTQFEGTTLLTISSTAAHKNLRIMVPVSEYLEYKHPNFKFRFVLTCNEFPFYIPEYLRHHFVFIGKVDVSECPNLYKQANIMFMPTLMECFTATYPEAMRMEVPIVTTDLEFARGLCGEAACYYSALDAGAAAEAIYKVANDEEYAHQLVVNGGKQLMTFDNYEQRAKKLIKILEELVKS